MKENEYKCELCKGVFKKTWTDKEALREMKDNFGKVPKKDRAIVCDDCYNALMLIQP